MTTETTARPAETHAPTAPPAGVRPGPIMLVRHGEPALSRRCMLSARQYREWWNTYEEGGLLDGQTPPDD
ncbi:MAG TPA: histidine phosphatase family protein, partial [Caulobacteraceae bacterium]